jgi:hypothetical protein
MADGWMYRLIGGPYAHNAYGPMPLDPPARIAVANVLGVPVLRDAKGYKPILVPDDSVTMVAFYDRTKKSQLTDEQIKEMPFMIKGAEYEYNETITDAVALAEAGREIAGDEAVAAAKKLLTEDA